MTRQILNSEWLASTAAPTSLPANLTSVRTEPPTHRFGDLQTTRPAFRLGSLWDPTLLDRLQAPLTRYHD